MKLSFEISINYKIIIKYYGIFKIMRLQHKLL